MAKFEARGREALGDQCLAGSTADELRRSGLLGGRLSILWGTASCGLAFLRCLQRDRVDVIPLLLDSLAEVYSIPGPRREEPGRREYEVELLPPPPPSLLWLESLDSRLRALSVFDSVSVDTEAASSTVLGRRGWKVGWRVLCSWGVGGGRARRLRASRLAAKASRTSRIRRRRLLAAPSNTRE